MRGGNIYGILGYIILSPRKKIMFEKMRQVLGLEVSKGEKGETFKRPAVPLKTNNGSSEASRPRLL